MKQIGRKQRVSVKRERARARAKMRQKVKQIAREQRVSAIIEPKPEERLRAPFNLLIFSFLIQLLLST